MKTSKKQHKTKPNKQKKNLPKNLNQKTLKQHPSPLNQNQTHNPLSLVPQATKG